MPIRTVKISNNAETLPATRIKEFGRSLSDSLSAHASVLLDLSEIQVPDIRIAQVVEAARKTAENVGATLTLAGSVDAGFIHLLDRAGFKTGEHPLWSQGIVAQ